MSTDVLDNVESVNVPKFIPHYDNEPFHPFFHPYKAEIEAFSRVHNHRGGEFSETTLTRTEISRSG